MNQTVTRDLRRGPSKYFDKVTDLYSDYENAENDDENDEGPSESKHHLERQISIINDWNGPGRKKKEQEKDYIIEQWEEEDEFENMEKYFKKGKIKEIGLEEYAQDEGNLLI